MQFRDIKQQSTVYILNKQDLTITQGIAVKVGFPRMHVNPKTNQTETVIDMDIDMGGKNGSYSIPEHLSVSYAGNLVFSIDQDGLIREVESMRTTAKQVLDSVDYQKEVLAKADALLADLSPIHKERKETEQRFAKLESSVNEMKDMMSKFIQEFKS